MNLDDPKLTAYALGELTGKERQAIEEQLVHSPEGRAYVEETAVFARLLREEFRTEAPECDLGDSAGLTPEQRDEVLEEADQADSGKIIRFTPRRIGRLAGIAAIAASVALFAGLSLFKSFQGDMGYSVRYESAILTPERKSRIGATQSSVDAKFAVLLQPNSNSSPTHVTAAKPLAPGISLLLVDASKLAALGSETEQKDTSRADAVIVAGGSVQANAGTLALDSAHAVTSSADRAKESFAKYDAPALKAAIQREIQFGKTTTVATATAGAVASGQLAEANTFTGGRVISSGATLSPAPAKGITRFTSGWSSSRRCVPNMGIAVPLAPSDTESYSPITENAFHEVAQNPLSTFSIDVDTASYANVRRFLTAGQLPPEDAVRIEELINYFHYDYPQPEGDAPFSANAEVAECPWAPEHRLVRIALAGRTIPESERPPCNLVFLLDVSGSMEDANKLPLLKQCMRLLLQQLGEKDRVSIVTYAGEAGVALQTVRGDQKEKIREVLDRLRADGSTNGGQGIQMAYETAAHAMIPNGTNRVILATDGDFNVGTTSESDLVRLIEEKAKSRVFLTVLGVGEGNLKDATMKKLASHGNGNYAYLDSVREGHKVLVQQLGGTLVTIAKNVKIQVEFNPRFVESYRLIGYESRMLRKQDFNDDRKDAGEIGSGHTVTALYEVVPSDGQAPGSVDPLKYQPKTGKTPVSGDNAAASEMLTIKMRYKKPNGDASILLEKPVKDDGQKLEQSSADFRFAAAVAEFGMLLRRSTQAGSATWTSAQELAESALGRDESGYRAEFLDLLEKAKELQGK